MASDVFQAVELAPAATAGRPSWEEYFMAVALLIATRSPCDRLHVGCVLVSGGANGNRIVASGYNGFLAGLPHESCIREGHELATVHAEQNAIADAAKRGVAVAGAQAYVTHYPCIHCAKILLAAGIGRICYREDYANDPLVERLCALAAVPIVALR
ncbi:MAG: dCMP deaminase [Puniceicoccales bacterium]|jgi:dCMP deaminase|nr:dCMP deaminase [Puniceicoccales bacterium]